METRVKERLTGALILVAALVILVPEIFSGRRVGERSTDAPPAAPATEGAPLRSYTARLDDAAPAVVDPAVAEAQSPAEAPPSTEPSAAAAEPRAPSPAPVEAPPVRAPPVQSPPASPPPTPPAARSEAAAPKPAPAPATVAGAWYVQVGSFSQAANAQRIAQELRGKGFAVVVLPPSGGGKLTRVRIGPAKDRDGALELQRRLAAAGQKGALVAP